MGARWWLHVLAPMDDAATALNDHLRGGSTKTIVAV